MQRFFSPCSLFSFTGKRSPPVRRRLRSQGGAPPTFSHVLRSQGREEQRPRCDILIGGQSGLQLPYGVEAQTALGAGVSALHACGKSLTVLTV